MKTIIAGLLALAGLGILSGWDTDRSTGANFAYYLDENKGGAPGSGRFQFPSYIPKKPGDSSEWLTGPVGGILGTNPNTTRVLGSGWGSVEAEAWYRWRASKPFLTGTSPLTEDNNITLTVKPILAPVTFHVETEIHWTPIAFLVFSGGIAAGTGWPLTPMGLDGLAINNMDDISQTERSGFAGMYFMGGTFQFDLAALIPGEWNHIIIQAKAKTRYAHYSKASAGEPWYWRADDGTNFNGWTFLGDYALGWMPPWKVNFIGFTAEHSFRLTSRLRDMSTVASGGWGSDFHKWRFGPAVNLELKDGHSITFVMQFLNGLYYSQNTVYARWFEHWSATGDQYIKLDRLAAAWTWAL